LIICSAKISDVINVIYWYTFVMTIFGKPFKFIDCFSPERNIY